MSETRSSLPPLPALRVFAAFVRHGQVRAVAEALNLTPGAVTYQLRALETHLGLRLLQKHGRSLQLSEDGRAYGYRIRQALDDIAAATREVGHPKARGRGVRQRTLRIALLPSFAQGWLLPRLADFARLCPDVRLSLEASVGLTGLSARRIDCAIRFGHGQWQDGTVTPLMGDRSILVASPALLSDPGQSLKRMRRLDSSENWGAWASSAGIEFAEDGNGMLWTFNDTTQQLEAARLGLGIALTRRSVADAALQTGLLVSAHAYAPPHTSAYYLLRPSGRTQDGALRDFVEWLSSACSRYAREQCMPLAVA